MPSPGYTALEALNETLIEIGHSPVDQSTYDSPTSGSNVAIIKQMLADETTKQLARGWRDNVDRGITVTLTSGWNASDLGDALDIRASGMNRKFSVRGEEVYDNEQKAVASDGNVVLDIARDISFEDCSQRLKEMILSHVVKRALMRFSPGDFSLRYEGIVDRILMAEFVAEPAWEDRHPGNGAKPYARTMGRQR